MQKFLDRLYPWARLFEKPKAKYFMGLDMGSGADVPAASIVKREKNGTFTVVWARSKPSYMSEEVFKTLVNYVYWNFLQKRPPGGWHPRREK